ncbi:MAG: EAL domain-containing protein [Lachnospiraceae bacterium]|nr:EAL domain-containing protein [Lachnospiraceae bacterium]
MDTDKTKEYIKTDEKYVYQSYTEYSPLTGLYFTKAFYKKVEEFLKHAEQTMYCVVAIDIEHFRLFNKIHGREQGDKLLVEIADTIDEFRRKNGGIVGYVGGDNFGVLMPYGEEVIAELCDAVTAVIRRWSSTMGFLPAFGIYPIDDVTVPAATMYDRATLAVSHVIGNYLQRSCVYTSDMEEKVEEEIKLLSEIQAGLQKEEFTFFIQPQCDIATGKIVGGESLVRWKHSTKGMISPGVFIPVLERNGFIADLDRYVWRKVCQWLRSLLDRGYKPVPISINVSRIDIFSMNVPAFLNELVETYNIPAKLLKVEVTESAYAESNDKIINAVKELRESEFLVMMDDFGSGYSSLNMLKEVSVDVLKMDMRFLDITESEEEKGIGILESVVNMAKQMRMPIIAEGVETQKQEDMLLKMGCRYSQGYYYYRPMPMEDFEKLISDERNLDLDGLWCRQNESIRLREFLDTNLFTDAMVNNILGAAAFYDMYENQIEITRVNEQYYRLAGVSSETDAVASKKFWNHVRDDDRQLLVSMFAQAYSRPTNGADGYLHFVREDGKVLWVYMRVFFLRERDGHQIFYGSLLDMTSQLESKSDAGLFDTEVEDLTDKQMERLEKYYGKLPCEYGVAKVILGNDGKVADYDIIYANTELGHVCGGDIARLRYLMKKLFVNKREELLDKAFRAAYMGEVTELETYSSISYSYLQFTFYQYQHGYVSFIVRNVTNAHIYEKTMENILLSYREVYFLHLEENYIRMIYPDDNHLIERGNYEETINRHFGTGRILRYDEEGIRNFLSLENLHRELAKQDTVEYKYRRSVQGLGEEWCLTSVNVCERKDGKPITAILTIRSIDALMREKEEQKHQNMAQVLANMSDGFFVYEATHNEKILYANPSVLKLYGCETMDEFRELVGNSFTGMVHPEDLSRIQWEIKEQVKHSDTNMDFIYYRIVAKDGTVRWVDDCGHLEDSDSGEDSRLFYVFITDVTEKLSGAEKEKLIRLNQHYNNTLFVENDIFGDNSAVTL